MQSSGRCPSHHCSRIACVHCSASPMAAMRWAGCSEYAGVPDGMKTWRRRCAIVFHMRYKTFRLAKGTPLSVRMARGKREFREHSPGNAIPPLGESGGNRGSGEKLWCRSDREHSSAGRASRTVPRNSSVSVHGSGAGGATVPADESRHHRITIDQSEDRCGLGGKSALLDTPKLKRHAALTYSRAASFPKTRCEATALKRVRGNDPNSLSL